MEVPNGFSSKDISEYYDFYGNEEGNLLNPDDLESDIAALAEHLSQVQVGGHYTSSQNHFGGSGDALPTISIGASQFNVFARDNTPRQDKNIFERFSDYIMDTVQNKLFTDSIRALHLEPNKRNEVAEKELLEREVELNSQLNTDDFDLITFLAKKYLLIFINLTPGINL